MKQKSKFTTFLLSFIPGLSHVYLGYAERGFIYLIIFGLLFAGGIGLAVLAHDDAPLIALVFAVPVIWLVALVDAFSTINAMRSTNGEEVKHSWNSRETKILNKKIITLALSIIPGAGHMYLGHQKKGLVLMGGFFFAIFFMGWLELSFLLFLLPLIWFYGFFDAFHTVNGSNVEDIDIDMTKFLPKIKSEYVGKGLIAIGVLIALQKILYPVLSEVLASYIDYNKLYRIRNYIQTSIVSLIFVFGGIKILKNNSSLDERDMDVIEEGENHEE